MNQLSTYLETALRAAEAAVRIQAYYLEGDLDISSKSNDTDLVTKVDKLCETQIREIILAAYPSHEIIGEEQGQVGNSTHRWIVDPLDGTLNYAHGFPYYCVSIALEIDGVLQVGVVQDGVSGERFSAIRGAGAFCNGQPIRVSTETDLRKSLLATGFAYHPDTIDSNVELFGRVHQQVRSIRRPGAAALDLCNVARGRFEAFWELKLNAWDVAAGMLIIQEAGGTLSNGLGEVYKLEDPVVVASNGHIHSKLLQVLGLGSSLA